MPASRDATSCWKSISQRDNHRPQRWLTLPHPKHGRSPSSPHISIKVCSTPAPTASSPFPAPPALSAPARLSPSHASDKARHPPAPHTCNQKTYATIARLKHSPSAYIERAWSECTSGQKIYTYDLTFTSSLVYQLSIWGGRQYLHISQMTRRHIARVRTATDTRTPFADRETPCEKEGAPS